MAVTVTFSKTQPVLDTTQGTQLVRGTIALTGSYVTGGDPFSLAKSPVQSSRRPISVQFWEEPAPGVVPTAMVFSYRNINASPNASNGTLQIQGGGTAPAGVPTAGIELAAGAYTAIMLAAVIKFEAIFPLGG